MAERGGADDRAAGPVRSGPVSPSARSSAGPARLVGRGGAAAAPDGTVIRIAFWAAALARVLGAVDAAAAAAGLDPAVGGSAAAGVIHAAVAEGAPAAAVARFVRDLRAALGGPSAAPAAAAELAAGPAAPPRPRGPAPWCCTPRPRCAPPSTCGARCPRSA